MRINWTTHGMDLANRYCARYNAGIKIQIFLDLENAILSMQNFWQGSRADSTTVLIPIISHNRLANVGLELVLLFCGPLLLAQSPEAAGGQQKAYGTFLLSNLQQGCFEGGLAEYRVTIS